MKLIINTKKGKKEYYICNLNEVNSHIKLALKELKVKKCTFEIKGEGEIRKFKNNELGCWFG